MTPMIAMDLTVITPTGDRPVAFDICRNWMCRQTVKPGKWLVIDDGKEMLRIGPPSPGDPGITHVRRTPRLDDPRHTLPLNLLRVLPMVTSKYVVIMEDDDWYHPTYLETMMELMPRSNTGVVGQDHTYYYRLAERTYCQASAPEQYRASLCSTGFRQGFIPTLSAICQDNIRKNSFYVDMDVWRKASVRCFTGSTVCVGIKQLPGRKGLSSGWVNVDGNDWICDDFGSKLRELIGDEDTDMYFDKIKETHDRNGSTGRGLG